MSEKMKFKYKCFIRKINQELIDKLTELGYEDLYTGYIITCEVKTMLLTNGNGWYLSGFEPRESDGYIDCGDNEDLFIAIAAINDENDYMQYFDIPQTVMKRSAGYYPQTIGMDGTYYEVIGHKYIQYDKKDKRISEYIKDEYEYNHHVQKDTIPHKLTINELFNILIK